MYELHKNEQYFFNDATLSDLDSFLSGFDNIGILCAPMLGQTLANSKKDITILDIDERFSNARGFRYWNIYRPERLPQAFEIIICDPPFFKVSLSQLFKAIRILSHYNFDQPLLISYLHRRANAITGTFSHFHLEPTGYFPGYVTVKDTEKNKIEFFGNLGKEKHQTFRTPL